jgi:hypothetical protein
MEWRLVLWLPALRDGGSVMRTSVQAPWVADVGGSWWPRDSDCRCCSGPTAILFLASGDDNQRVIRKRALQPQCLESGSHHPDVDLLLGRQDHRHGFRVIGAHEGVWLRRQKAEDVVGGLALLHLPDRGPAGPDAGKAGERAAFIQREPDRRPRPIWQYLVFREAGEWHDTAVLDPEPSSPVGGVRVADVGHARVVLERGRQRLRGMTDVERQDDGASSLESFQRRHAATPLRGVSLAILRGLERASTLAQPTLWEVAPEE